MAIETQAVMVPDVDKLRMLLANGAVDVVLSIIEKHKLPYRIENGELRDALEATDIWLQKFITEDADIIAMKDDVRRLAKTQDEVLITGDTGTGKELLARAMIGNRQGRFVATNCAGFPETLIESILFGYVRGAFTGADNTKAGLMSVAKDGVLFLDEIGELPLSVQAKLLRALQDKKIMRVGSNNEEDINCKFVCATNRNIKKMVDDGTFRRDLYARIGTFELHIKPLTERECDIVPILKSLDGGPRFLDALGKKSIHLHRLDLSNNVRSLQQSVKRYNVLGRIIL